MHGSREALALAFATLVLAPAFTSLMAQDGPATTGASGTPAPAVTAEGPKHGENNNSRRQTHAHGGDRIESGCLHQDALPVERYVGILEMVRQIQAKLLGAVIMDALKKIDLPGVDFTTGKQFAQTALQAVRVGKLGYGVITSRKC